MRDGVWECRPYLGTDGVTGRRMRPYRRFPEAKSEEEALTMAEEWLSTVAPAVSGVGRRLGSMLEAHVSWLESMGSPGNTVAAYRQAARRVSSVLGDVPFDKVRPSDVSAALRALMARGGRGGGPLSAATVTQARAFLSSAYARWVDEGLVASNPVSPVPNPRPDGPGRAVALAELDYASVWRALVAGMAEGSDAATRSVCMAAWLALVAGLRCGEACALRLRDVSYVRREVEVSGTVVERPALARQGHPKSRSGVRSIPLCPDDMEVVRAHASWAAPWRSGEHGTLVCSPSGGLVRPSEVSRGFRRIAAAAGLPRGATFHTLRHTFASWLLASGENVRTIQELLGHADVRTTLALYGHLLPGARASAMGRAKEVRDSVTGAR